MKKLATIAMMIALSIVFSILESFIPTIIVGAKLGLANIIVLIALYIFGIKEASLILIVRILLVSLLQATFLSPVFYMSLSGGIVALVVMILLKKLKFHIIPVSMAGAIMHGLGQIIIAVIIISPKSIYYYPLMALAGLATGLLTGILAYRIIKIYKKYLEGEIRNDTECE